MPDRIYFDPAYEMQVSHERWLSVTDSSFINVASNFESNYPICT